jgi:hypothetical protein
MSIVVWIIKNEPYAGSFDGGGGAFSFGGSV